METLFWTFTTVSALDNDVAYHRKVNVRGATKESKEEEVTAIRISVLAFIVLRPRNIDLPTSSAAIIKLPLVDMLARIAVTPM